MTGDGGDWTNTPLFVFRHRTHTSIHINIQALHNAYTLVEERGCSTGWLWFAQTRFPGVKTVLVLGNNGAILML